MLSSSDKDNIDALYNKWLLTVDIWKELWIRAHVVKIYLASKWFESNYWNNKRLKHNGVSWVCTRCGITKDLKYFQFNKYLNRKWYYNTYCNSCRYKWYRVYYMDNESKFFNMRQNYLKNRCKRSWIPYSLPDWYLEKVYKQQDWMCFYSGRKIKLISSVRSKCKDEDVLSIDRIEPHLWYIIWNVALCIDKINTSKSNLTLQDIKERMPSWYKKIVLYKTMISNWGG